MAEAHIRLPSDEVGKRMRTVSSVMGEGVEVHDTVVRLSNRLGEEINPATNEQSLDSNNTKTVTAAVITATDPWVGEWTQTRSKGFVRQLVTLVATDTTEDGLGGTFTFEYGEDGATAIISEARVISDFQTVRDFDLLNAGEYFRVKFTPDRALASDSVFITTTQRRTNDGSFVRLAGQQIEEANAAMPQTFSYLKAFVRETGKSINIRANKGESILVSEFDTEVALGNVPNYAVNTKFGRVKAIDAADSAVDIWAFADDTASPRANTKTFPEAVSSIFVTSSSTSDTDVDVTIEGIAGNGTSSVLTVNTNGQTPVDAGFSGLDVNRMYVSGASSALGILYASVGNDFTGGAPNDVTDILAMAPAGYQQSQLSQFTVPAGKTLVMSNILLTVSRASGGAGSADVTLRIKEFGGISRIRREFFPTTSVPVTNGIHNLVVPARAQIVWRVDDVSDTDTHISIVWGYKLIDD